MIVRLPVLIATGYYEFEVDAKNLTEARKLVQQSQCKLLTGAIEDIKLNYDGIQEIQNDMGITDRQK